MWMWMLFIRIVISLIILLYMGYETFSSQSLMPLLWGCFAILILWLFSILYCILNRKSPDESAWQMRTTEVAPVAELIHVEVRVKDGRKKVIWNVSPDGVDFTDNAEERVICFMVASPRAGQVNN